MTLEERRERLLGWMNIVYQKVQEVIINDYIFWEVQRIIENNPKFKEAPGFFNQWMASTFIHSSAVAVRLQNMTGRNSVSLRGVLEELQRHPEMISRAYFVSLYGDQEWKRDMGNNTFDNIAGEGNDHLDPKRIQEDLRKLEGLSRKIHHYTNRRIAHYDERGFEPDIPTFNDLGEALIGLEQLVIHYKLVTEAVSMDRLLPTFQFEWKEVFCFPWVTCADGEPL